MKNKITSFILFTIAIASFSFTGCSKKDDVPGNATNKVVFKAEASAGSSLSLAVYGYDATLTTASSLGGTSWTSPEITVPASANVASVVLNAMGASASSTLKVQVFVNGTLKKEGTSSGTALSATAQYNLK